MEHAPWNGLSITSSKRARPLIINPNWPWGTGNLIFKTRRNRVPTFMKSKWYHLKNVPGGLLGSSFAGGSEKPTALQTDLAAPAATRCCWCRRAGVRSFWTATLAFNSLGFKRQRAWEEGNWKGLLNKSNKTPEDARLKGLIKLLEFWFLMLNRRIQFLDISLSAEFWFLDWWLKPWLLSNQSAPSWAVFEALVDD